MDNQNREFIMRTGQRITLESKLEGYDRIAWRYDYCKQCGAEFVGYTQTLCHTFHTRDRLGPQQRVVDEYNPMRYDVCPICGGHFFSSDIPLEYPYGPRISKVITHASESRRLQSDRDSTPRIEQLKQTAICDITVPAASRSEEIKSDPQKLKDYVRHLIQIEGNIYAIERRLAELYFQKAENDKYVVFCNNRENLIATISEIEHKNCEKQCSLYDAKIQELRKDLASPWEYPKEPQKPQLFHVGAFDFIHGNAARNKLLMAEYEKEMEEYRKKVVSCDEHNAWVKKRVAEISTEIENLKGKITDIRARTDRRIHYLVPSESTPVRAQTIKLMLDQEIQQAEETLRKLAATRAEYYGTNIVFGKYRDMVTLSTFYEYLIAGRCTSLEGTNGAYNLYESELRANLIIAKLSDIVEKLEEIKNNQYTITSLLQNINRQMASLNASMYEAGKSLDRIDKNTARIAETSEMIAHNTAVNAYYSKLNAELTNSMGYLMAYKL